jgi:riboflavin biosynthesis pyrimidine reductase
MSRCSCSCDDVAMAREGGVPIWCVAYLRRVHGLREQFDAVAVGGRTWEQDRPRCTCRDEHLGRAPRRQQAPVVFAGSRTAEVWRGQSRPFVVGTHDLAGARCIPARDRDLAAPLAELFRQGIASLLVEGGLTLLDSFIAQRLVDEAMAYVATHDVAMPAFSRSCTTKFRPRNMATSSAPASGLRRVGPARSADRRLKSIPSAPMHRIAPNHA